MDSQGALGDIIASLMSNPEIMKTVTQIANNQGPQKSDDIKEEKTQENEEEPTGFSIPPDIMKNLPEMMSMLSGAGIPSHNKGEKHHPSQRKELLCALKPFLSAKRCSVIDGILQFEGLAGVLDVFKSSNDKER